MEFTPIPIREGLCFMTCSPLNSRRIGAALPLVLKAMRRRFLNVGNDVLLDAAAAAVERCITSGFLQHDRSFGEVVRWLQTATANELLREFRFARRYAALDVNAAALEAMTGGHRTDARAAQNVLRSWLVERFGAAVAETVWLHMIEGCPPRDIAAIQKISVGSIKARITRARKVMRRFSDVLA